MKEFIPKINLRKVLLYALYIFVTLVIQDMLLSQFRIFGVCPMVLPAAAVAAGMFEGATWGSVIAVVIGVFADMAFPESTVTFTLLFPVLSFAAGFISQFYINKRFFAFMLASLGALLVTALVQMLHVMVTDSFSLVMISTVVMQTLWSLPFAALAYFPPAKWIN